MSEHLTDKQKKRRERFAEREAAIYKITPPLTLADVAAMTPQGHFTPRRKSVGHHAHRFLIGAQNSWGKKQARKKSLKRALKFLAHAHKLGISPADLREHIDARRKEKNDE